MESGVWPARSRAASNNHPMATINYNSTAANYAQALIELAQQQNITEQIGAELADLQQIVNSDPLFQTFLANPSISQRERGAVVEKTIRSQVHPLLANFLGVLQLHNRLDIIDQVAAAYAHKLDQLQGKIEVDVTVAQGLSEEQLDQVRERISTALNKTAVVKQTVNPEIIGGLVVRVEDKLIDASVKTQLQSIKQQLLSKRPK